MARDKKEVARLNTPVGRLINSALWEKDVYTTERGQEATPKYKVELAFDETDEFAAFEDAVVAAAIDFFGDDAEEDYNEGRVRSPILVGDDLAEEREKKGKSGDAYRGKLVIRASTIYNRNGEDAPGGVYVCGPDAKELDFAERGKVYNGCHGIASVTLNPHPGIAGGLPGVSLYLNGFQKVEDGDPLRGVDPSTLFSPMMGEDSEKKGRRARGKK